MNNSFHNTANFSLRPLAVALILGGSLTSAFATNGYFSHGYGMKAKGMGGASVAMTDNAFAGANNPAVAAWAGNRVELGVDVFMPSREATGLGGASSKSDSNTFYIPEFGYNTQISDKLGAGITLYGNGGMNTDYGTNILGGTGRLGVDLQQLIVAPTIAYKIDESHSVGVSPLLVQQIFKADGLGAFGGYSTASSSLTNNGYDSSTGFGVRVGYLGKWSDMMTFGASYAPKIAMSKLSKYAGLFADQGSFDIPANYAFGLAIKASKDTTVAIDYEKIMYSGVGSIGNTSTTAGPGTLGATGGTGFGWTDVGVWKLGVQWQASSTLTMRAGLNIGDNPVKSENATFNIVAPGVVTTHYTLGGTYALSKDKEVTMSYMYAPSSSVSGPIPAGFGGGTATEAMSQQSLGIQFGWKF